MGLAREHFDMWTQEEVGIEPPTLRSVDDPLYLRHSCPKIIIINDLKSLNIGPPENLIFADLQWFNVSPRSSHLQVYSRAL